MPKRCVGYVVVDGNGEPVDGVAFKSLEEADRHALKFNTERDEGLVFHGPKPFTSAPLTVEAYPVRVRIEHATYVRGRGLVVGVDDPEGAFAPGQVLTAEVRSVERNALNRADAGLVLSLRRHGPKIDRAEVERIAAAAAYALRNGEPGPKPSLADDAATLRPFVEEAMRHGARGATS